MYLQNEMHFVKRSGWLRAAVLGSNDGILSTTSLVIGVAAASSTRAPIILAALAGLVAGALSMAAGEYVSVSSQSDIETADLQREQAELATMPEEELIELAAVYQKRGLDKTLSLEVARQLTQHNALEAHARDELGINEITQAKPLQAALASGASFTVGGALPLLVSLVAPVDRMEIIQYVCSIVFLAISGIIAARAGGSNPAKAVIRICFWGTIAMAITALAGYLFGTSVS
ncbi:MAG: VIT family protein [Chitinophagaceae bacterium]|nr:MAG: VIT family protein [Chitinophagaceae bacterium]